MPGHEPRRGIAPGPRAAIATPRRGNFRATCAFQEWIEGAIDRGMTALAHDVHDLEPAQSPAIGGQQRTSQRERPGPVLARAASACRYQARGAGASYADLEPSSRRNGPT